ncbi:uncharacterized protein LOC119190429 [Manduca sexta]|uniref:uncharacterized protein LOC119190429 n=1 Tax=Manduca sexta TaxID=7130 RepID=UPI00188F7683|nr:uncharacterized protein LOC119190429 [Manduca sexta]
MPNNNDDPPDRGPNPFRKSGIISRSPSSAKPKRLFSENSPSINASPEINRSASQNTVSPRSDDNIEKEDNYCDLVSEAANYLSKINELVNDQGSRMNVANKSAIMDFTQRITAIVSVLALKSSCNETKLANAQRELEGIKNCPRPTPPKADGKMTYASSVKLRLPKQAPAMEPRAPLPCVVAYPTSERTADLTSSSATKQALFNAIKPSDDGFQIVGVKKTAKAGVVLRVANERQIHKLQSVDALKSAGLRLEKPKGRRPRILIKDVPSSMEDKPFLTALYRQNIKDEMPIKEDDFIKSVKIVRRRSLEHGRKWIGVEIDSEVRKHLVATKDKLFIDWATCRFIDDVEIVRCLNCQQYGHVHKFCTIKTPTCAVCAEAHETKACPHKDNRDFKPVCATCKRFKKPHDHRCGNNINTLDCVAESYSLIAAHELAFM